MDNDNKEKEWQFWYFYYQCAKDMWATLNTEDGVPPKWAALAEDLNTFANQGVSKRSDWKIVCRESTISKIKPTKGETGDGVSLDKLRVVTVAIDKLLAADYQYIFDFNSVAYFKSSLTNPAPQMSALQYQSQQVASAANKNVLQSLQGTYKVFALSHDGRYVYWSAVALEANGTLYKRTAVKNFDYQGEAYLFGSQGYLIAEIKDEKHHYFSYSVFRLGNLFANSHAVPIISVLEGVTNSFSINGNALGVRCLLVAHSPKAEDFANTEAGSVAVLSPEFLRLLAQYPFLVSLLGRAGNVVVAENHINPVVPKTDNLYPEVFMEAARAAAAKKDWNKALDRLTQAVMHGYSDWFYLAKNKAFVALLAYLQSLNPQLQSLKEYFYS